MMGVGGRGGMDAVTAVHYGDGNQNVSQHARI